MHALTDNEQQNQTTINNHVHIKPEHLIKLPNDWLNDSDKNGDLSSTGGWLQKTCSRIKQFWVSYCELNRLFVKYHTLSHYAKDVNRQAAN